MFGLTLLVPELDGDFPPCTPMVHARFDAYEGGFRTSTLGVLEERRSFQRRFLRSEGGRAVLQDANTSATDIFGRPLTPGMPASSR